jgi:hypothetical protein
VRMTLIFPKGRSPFAEPLVCTGREGSGDTIYVRYVDSGHVVFGMDHWGSRDTESRPVEFDPDRPHELIIASGSLLPPPLSAVYRSEPALDLTRGHLLVEMDGRVVLSRHVEFYPDHKSSIHFGANLIGGSTTVPYFSGAVTGFGPAPFEEVARSIPTLAAERIRRDRAPAWQGALGPVRLSFIMPEREPGPSVGQPILSIVGPHTRQVLFVVRDGERVRVGFDNMGFSAAKSEPMALSPSGTDELDISVGALLPAVGAPVYGEAPNFIGMRRMIYVSLNHRLALFAAVPEGTDTDLRCVFGANLPGSSACAPFFMGDFVSIAPAGFEDIPVGRLATSDFMERLARPGWGGYTGPLRFAVAFGPGQPGDAQPILSTGVTGKGDIVFVRYEPDGMARICVDHWGSPLVASEPFALVPGAAHDLTLSIGSLYPPESALGPEGAAIESLRSRVRVYLDGRRIMDCDEASFPTLPEWITIGSNFLGGSTAGAAFFGDIQAVSPADLSAVQR